MDKAVDEFILTVLMINISLGDHCGPKMASLQLPLFSF